MPYVITAEHLKTIAGIKTPLMAPLSEWINKTCPKYEIDTPQEFCHFLAQACHETDRFRTLVEYASGEAYEGRKELGNTWPGDGVRFKGRGIFQTTGRNNYIQLSAKGWDPEKFIGHPELLQQPEYAVWSACVFWDTRNLNDVANYPDTALVKKKYRGRIIEVSPIEYISIAINGGWNGMRERKQYYEIAKTVLV